MNLAELETLAQRIRAGVNAVKAIQRAMEGNTEAAENWAAGLWFVCDILHENCEELQELLDQAFSLEAKSGGQEPEGKL